MFTDNYSFPHPVLGLGNDIEGDFNCSIKLSRNDTHRTLKFHSVNYEISNSYFENLVNDGTAGVLFKVYCSSTYKTWTFLNPGESFEINENDLANKVEIEALIISTTEINDYHDETFNEQFEQTTFSIRPKEVIAVSGKSTLKIEKVNEKLGLGNIFSFKQIEFNKPVEFSYTQDKIFIMCPVDESGNYPPNALFKMTPWTAYSLFIVPALQGAFRFIKEERSLAESYEWFLVVSNLLPEDQWNSDPFISAQILLDKGIPILNSYKDLTQPS